MSATTRTSLSSSAQGEASAPRADGSAAPQNAHSLAQTLRASRGVMSTHQRPPQRHVDAEAAQSSTNGAREAGARAELVFQTAKHNAAVVATENDRLGAMKFGPAAQIGHLICAQHGKRATEGLGSLHVRFFTGGMMLKWRDVLSMPSDSMSNAHAADCSPRTYRRTRIWGWGTCKST